MSKKYPTNQFLQNAIKDAFDSQTSEPKHLADDEDLLLRWAEQRLSKEEHAELLDHLSQCSNCRLAVSEMVKNGILEFNEQPTKQLQSSVTRSKNTFRYTTLLFLGGLMTSTICLLLCLFFLQGTPNQTDVARIEVTGQQTDPNSKLGGTVRSVSNPADKSNKFALLVGINKYGKLKENEWLDGCRNDIEAVKSVITGRLGFVAENVVVLLDEQATRDEIL
ncbi:MAG: caspase family protein, partial [Planctomycetaceae bacterium]|nr:caspase family protein [Planctomycetaceae bacterium]